MAFRVGQKVVCIGGDGTPKPIGYWKSWAREWGITLATRGNIYTIRCVRVAADGTQRVRLIEIVNPIIEFNNAPSQEMWFWASHFRPIVERKTDISIFTKMLTSKKIGADA